MKTCHACGKEIPESAKVCGYCGTKQAVAPPPSPPLDPVEAVTDPAPPIEPMKEEVTVVPSPPDSEPEVVVPEPELFVPEPEFKPGPEPKPEPVKKTERSKKGGRGWLWVVIGIAVIAIVVVVLGPRAPDPPPEGWEDDQPSQSEEKEDTGLVAGEQDPEPEEVIEFTVVEIARSCYEDNSVITLPAGEPLELHYGYWGVSPDYLQENLDYMEVVGKLDENIIDATSGYFVESPLLPCVNQENYADVVWENAVWIYNIAQIDPLSPGEYAFEFTYTSDRIISDGFEDENGNMTEYGPGEFYILSLTLIVEP